MAATPVRKMAVKRGMFTGLRLVRTMECFVMSWPMAREISARTAMMKRRGEVDFLHEAEPEEEVDGDGGDAGEEDGGEAWDVHGFAVGEDHGALGDELADGEGDFREDGHDEEEGSHGLPPFGAAAPAASPFSSAETMAGTRSRAPMMTTAMPRARR